MSAASDTTLLLQAARAGDAEAHAALWPRLYGELRRIAHARLLKHRPGDTLNTTALVHEAYLKLVDSDAADWRDRTHFLSLTARAMRLILIDYARTQTAAKRGGAQDDLPLDSLQVAAGSAEADAVTARAADLLTLNDALDRLTARDERLGRLIELRFFGGLSYPEIAEATGLSVPTIKRDWRRARMWLYQAMQGELPDDDPPAPSSSIQE